ncbi:MAG: adenylyl-sulfate kinase [Alphaproteobacteria bacterium]|nr:adenylyl-sulfate kinase [Alphaproteobacteria bacterium]
MDTSRYQKLLQQENRLMTTTAPGPGPLRIAIQIPAYSPTLDLSGELLSGEIKVGDRVLFSPDNQAGVVSEFELSAENRINLSLTSPIHLAGSALVSHEDDVPVQTDVFLIKLDTPLSKDQILSEDLEVRICTNQISVSVVAPDEALNTHKEITVRCAAVVAVDEYDDLAATGSCELFLDGIEISRGQINMKGYADQRQLRTVRATNITRVNHRVTDEDRRNRFGHTGGVLWLTGLSGSGKSTLAVELETELFNRGYQVYVLDGDNIRHGLNANLGFSPEDRSENIRRVGEVAALFARAGFIAISAFISPYQSDRERARAAADDFHEVFVSADLGVCENRDPKGLYAKARKGEIPDFTGISAPYELPEKPELTVDTGNLSVEQSVLAVLEYVTANFGATPEHPGV